MDKLKVFRNSVIWVVFAIAFSVGVYFVTIWVGGQSDSKPVESVHKTSK